MFCSYVKAWLMRNGAVFWRRLDALQPEIKCVVGDFQERDVPMEGVDLIRGLGGPSALLNAVEKLLTQKAPMQTT